MRLCLSIHSLLRMIAYLLQSAVSQAPPSCSSQVYVECLIKCLMPITTVSPAMQLSRTLTKVPQDLLCLKKEKVQERLSQAAKCERHQSYAAAPGHKPGHNRQAEPRTSSTALPAPAVEPATTNKRVRVMTARMLSSSAPLNTLRQSLGTA